MADLVHELISSTARRVPERDAVKYQGGVLTYRTLASATDAFARAMIGMGLARSDRVAIYAEKRLETIVAMFGTAAAGGAYVPVNPLLKPGQVAYILADCSVRVLVTTAERLELLAPFLHQTPELRFVVVMGTRSPGAGIPNGTTT
jgi:acyl-CoA synthetase (AMP-forming)/AMP-acid ligase II